MKQNKRANFLNKRCSGKTTFLRNKALNNVKISIFYLLVFPRPQIFSLLSRKMSFYRQNIDLEVIRNERLPQNESFMERGQYISPAVLFTPTQWQ